MPFLPSISTDIYCQSAKTIIDIYLEKIGGVKELKKIKILKRDGFKITPKRNNLTEPMTEYFMYPNKFLLHSIQVEREVKLGFDGKVSWTLYKYPQRTIIRKHQDFGEKANWFTENYLLNNNSNNVIFERMADTIVNQVPVFAIKMMINSEKEIRYYFDRESYLLIQKEGYITNKFSAELALSKSESALVIRYDEYRTVENYLIPFVVESEFPIGWIVRQEFKFVEVNPKGVNKKIFKMPVIKIAKKSAIEIEIPNK